MSSASSTERGRPGRDTGFQLWHVFLLLSMCGAIWVVIVSRHTEPAALMFISAAVIGSGVVGFAMYYALSGFFGGEPAFEPAPLATRVRAALEEEKALVLRSLKELEFDRAMGKVSDADFAEIGGPLRERAVDIMARLDDRSEQRSGVRGPGSGVPSAVRRGKVRPDRPDLEPTVGHRTSDAELNPGPRTPDPGLAFKSCLRCQAPNDLDARFCKHCGAEQP
jgi:hypothetical protein